MVSGLHAMAACLCSMAITGLDVEEVYSAGTRIPGAPKYREYMRRQQGKLWNTVEHKAHLEYQSLVSDLVLESEYLG